MKDQFLSVAKFYVDDDDRWGLEEGYCRLRIAMSACLFSTAIANSSPPLSLIVNAPKVAKWPSVSACLHSCLKPFCHSVMNFPALGFGRGMALLYACGFRDIW